jgi:UDP-N-acetylglucosamine acyltransferase
MTMIDPSARIDPAAEIGEDVEIGPWVSIGEGVRIGARTRIGAHCVMRGPTEIGADNQVFPFCSIGDAPQDKKYTPGVGESRLVIGDRNVIREYCSINRGTPGGGGVTRLGDDNWIMAYCHVAHDCQIGSHTVFSNNTTLAGHVEIADHVILGGFTGVHQFCRMGEGSFSAIAAIIVRDVPPFVIVKGNSARPRSINSVGLKRRGFDAATIATIKRCYRALFREGRRLDDALVELERAAVDSPEARTMLEFIRASSRGIVR